MKKIDFGVNNDKKLNASFSEISPYNGEYLGVIGYERDVFLVTRIIDSVKGLNGNIDVREITQDYFADGSSFVYANQEKNQLCQKFEKLLNTDRFKQMLDKGDEPYTVLRNAGFPVAYLPRYYVEGVEPRSEKVSNVVTSVKPNLFADLKESQRNALGRSYYNMYKELEKLKAEVQRLRGESDLSNPRLR